MRALFGFLLGMTGFVFLFGSIGLGVYLDVMTERGVDGSVEALFCAGLAGFFAMLAGYGILDDLASKKNGSNARSSEDQEFEDDESDDNNSSDSVS